MSIPDEFFKTEEPEAGSKAPYASAIAIIIAVAIVVLVVMGAAEQFSLKNLFNKEDGSAISIEEKQRILDELKKNAAEMPQIPIEEKQRILDELQKKAADAPEVPVEEKKRILDELQKKSQ